MADKLVMYVVVDNERKQPFAFDTLKEADVMRSLWDERHPNVAPHQIIRMEETK